MHVGKRAYDFVCSDPMMRHSAVREKQMDATPQTQRMGLVVHQVQARMITKNKPIKPAARAKMKTLLETIRSRTLTFQNMSKAQACPTSAGKVQAQRTPTIMRIGRLSPTGLSCSPPPLLLQTNPPAIQPDS